MSNSQNLESFMTAKMRDLGLTQKDVARMTSKTEAYVNDVIKGRRGLSPDYALDLEDIGFPSADELMQLRLNERREDPERKLKAEIRDYQYAAAVKRGWLPSAQDPITQYAAIQMMLERHGISETSLGQVNFRAKVKSPATELWIARCLDVAKQRLPLVYDPADKDEMVRTVIERLRHVDTVSAIGDAFQVYGVHLVVVQQLPSMRVDGALLWLDKTPVIALTLRYDRIDWLAFTLLHEMAHLYLGHRGSQIDVYEDRPNTPEEQEADEKAQEWLLNESAYDSFVRRCAGRFSAASIRSFAFTQDRHPGIIVGRLQRDGFIPWSHLRALLEPVASPLEKYTDKEHT